MDRTNTLQQTKIEVDRATEQYARFTIGPLEGGYGTTVGNALRRVLLSSLGGAAVTSVKLADVYHEFSTIPNTREDTTQFLLNIKRIRFQPLVDEQDAEWRLTLDAQGEGLVTAADLQVPPDLEIVNPEQELLTLDSDDAEIHAEFVVQTGSGYSPSEERGKLTIGELPVDAIFSPVRRVAFEVAKTRVGRLTDYDSLRLDVWTDGALVPEDALKQAAEILAEQFRYISSYGVEEPEVVEGEAEGIPTPVYETPIEELELSVRAYNCLKRAGLTRVGEILERMAQGEEEILVIRNFGQKSLDELKDSLKAKGFELYLPEGQPAADGAATEEQE